MGARWLLVYRAVLLIAIVLGLVLFYQAIEHQEKPGARPFLLLITGALFYVCVKLAVSIVRGTPTVFIITRLNPVGAGLATVGFFLLVIEYTGVENPVSTRTTSAVLIVPAVVSSLVWLDIEYLWVPVRRDTGTLSGYAWEITSIAIANQLYMNILLILGIGLLVRFGIQSSNIFKMQIGALVFAALWPMVGNLMFYFGYIPVNPTPVIFVVSALIIAWAVLRTGFLDLIPIGRDAVLSNLDAGVLTIDDDHRLIDINESGRQLLNLESTETAVGQHVDEVLADQPPLKELYWTLTNSKSDQESVIELNERYYTVEIIQFGTADERVLGHSLIIRDITDQKLREQEIKQKKKQLERVTSIISHDIRNPLSVIQGRVRLARQEDDDKEHLDNITANADRIQDIIEDALAMTRETEPHQIESINVGAVARRAWSHVEMDGIRLETDGDFSIEGDPNRLTQLFENLFRNVVEHGGDAEVVRVGGISGDDGRIHGFFVADDGVGIPEKERETVLEDGYTTSNDGTGLGLSIVAGIIDTHGWKLEVTESERGGTRFEIDLGICDGSDNTTKEKSCLP